MFSRMPSTPDGKHMLTFEQEHLITKFIGLYDSDPCSGVRERTLEFVAKYGGVRVIRVDDIIDYH